MTGRDLIHIFEYDEWATNKLLDAAAKLDTNAFDKDLGTSFRSLHGLRETYWAASFSLSSRRELVSSLVISLGRALSKPASMLFEIWHGGFSIRLMRNRKHASERQHFDDFMGVTSYAPLPDPNK